jgi:hypothetical protein
LPTKSSPFSLIGYSRTISLAMNIGEGQLEFGPAQRLADELFMKRPVVVGFPDRSS